jgi:alkylation response protein AidB-like acyl-CoA dehydrogenase
LSPADHPAVDEKCTNTTEVDQMSFGFEADPLYQARLDWAESFVTNEVQPLDRAVEHACDMSDPLRQTLIPPLQRLVREKGLWATHLSPELGGQGYCQVKLSLLNEIVGRTHCGPVVFGIQAPDTGNTEILAHYGTPELKDRYLRRLIENEIVSAYAMTEPQGGSNPVEFTTVARRDGDEWVINGEKWFTSNARFAAFYIIMAVTDSGAAPHRRLSMFVVPADTPGISIVRNTGVWGHDHELGTHAYTRWEDVRIPHDHILGGVGQGFEVAQTRLGGGRIHHAMRTVGLVKASLNMMIERAASRSTRGSRLAAWADGFWRVTTWDWRTVPPRYTRSPSRGHSCAMPHPMMKRFPATTSRVCSRRRKRNSPVNLKRFVRAPGLGWTKRHLVRRVPVRSHVSQYSENLCAYRPPAPPHSLPQCTPSIRGTHASHDQLRVRSNAA